MMQLQAFTAQSGAHCESTMLRNMLFHAGIDLSEPMIFGLGEGIDFQYYKSPDPARTMFTGRNDAGTLARNACAALGVELIQREQGDEELAHTNAARLIEAGHVVGVTADIFYLDYFNSQTHFSAHCIAVYGLDETGAQIVDTEQDGGAQSLPAASLRNARASKKGYMPSPNRELHIQAPTRVNPDEFDNLLVGQSWSAIQAASSHMLTPRRETAGLAGLRLAAAELVDWAETLEDPATSVPGLGRFWRYAGTGGTNFRSLFCDFLTELQTRSNDEGLPALVAQFQAIDGQWVALIDRLIGFDPKSNRRSQMEATKELFLAIADAEEAAFTRLLALAESRLKARV